MFAASCLVRLTNPASQYCDRQVAEDENLAFVEDLPEFTQDELLATPTDEPEVVAGEGDAQPEAEPRAGPDAPRDRGRHFPPSPQIGRAHV